ncbi:MAG: AAA family ATPase [Deltaproteobacteria bacterium]|nr:AAA family ATPase [Deltaproteobacteria bacterium]
MIKRLRITGYKSFKDVEVHFEPLSIIFGPNAAGKSNLLDALGLVSRIVTRKNLQEAFEQHRGLPLESFYYGELGYEKLLEQDIAEAKFEVDVELSKSTVKSLEKLIAEKRKGISTEERPHKRITERYLRYSVTIQILPKSGFLRLIDESLRALRKDGKVKARRPFVEKEWSSGKERLHLRMEGQAHPTYYDLGLDHSIISTPLYEPHYPHITAFRHEISKWRFYYFEPRTLMREDVPAKEIEAIGPRGENLAAFLNAIQVNDGKQMEAFNLSLKYLLPSIENISIDRTKEGLLSLKVIENGLYYSSRLISEGTLRILGLLAALHPASPTNVIGYEEPENGVHPTRLKLVADLFKNTQEMYGKQIIINTHSPIFPTYFEDRFLFVCRKEGSDTKIVPFKSTGPLFRTKDISRALEERILRGDYGG